MRIRTKNGIVIVKDTDEFKEIIMSKMQYMQELRDIKGIGSKLVDDIVALYPTYSQLKETIDSGNKVPLRDDIVEKLKGYINGN